MGLPQVPLGSHIRPTDRLTGTYRHTHAHTLLQSILCPNTHSSYSTPAHMLPRHGALCIKQWLCSTSIFFRHKIIFHPSSLSMLHGSFEMNNGNNRAEDSWDPFKDVGEAMQSGFGLQKHHAPSKWICYCSALYRKAAVNHAQAYLCQQRHVNTFSFKSGEHSSKNITIICKRNGLWANWGGHKKLATVDVILLQTAHWSYLFKQNIDFCLSLTTS